MRLPKYYCPHCKRFKKWYQVIDAFDYDDHSFDFRVCKHCGTMVMYTVDLFENFIEKYWYEISGHTIRPLMHYPQMNNIMKGNKK